MSYLQKKRNAMFFLHVFSSGLQKSKISEDDFDYVD